VGVLAKLNAGAGFRPANTSTRVGTLVPPLLRVRARARERVWGGRDGDP
jgi:hypothetical protein